MQQTPEQYKKNRLKYSVICEYCGCTVLKAKYQLSHPIHFCNNQCKGKWMSENLKDEKGYNWKGGKHSRSHNFVNNSAYRSLRQLILNENIGCCSCSGKECLQVHHVLPKFRYSKLKMCKKNLVVLCFECHQSLHKLTNGMYVKQANSVKPVTGDAVGNTELSDLINTLSDLNV